MNIFLVNPPFIEAYGQYKAAAKVGAQPQMPLGIAYIAAVAEKGGHNVTLVDADVEGMSIDDVIQRIRELKPRIVGTTATTPIYASARMILEKTKEHDPSVITILGGFHITALPERTMNETKAADYGAIGEGEETFREFLKKIESGQDIKDVKGLAYREDGKVVINTRAEPVSNLKSLPYPARHLLKTSEYIWSVPGEGLVPVTSMITQRGCPFNCIFCGVETIFPGKTRYREMEDIIAEIEEVVNVYGIKHIMFCDDTLTLNKEKVLTMCNEIEKRGLNFTFEGYTRANTVDKEILSRLKQSGLVRLSFGVESGNRKILEAIKKGITLDQLKRAYNWCHELRIETRCSLMIGHPFETKETIRQTIEFVKKELKVYQAYINITTPYPGSELYELARQGYGGLKLLSDDWSEYRRYGNSVMEMNDLSAEDLIVLQKKLYRQFYLRPSIIWYNVKRAGLKAAFVNGVAFFKSMFSVK